MFNVTMILVLINAPLVEAGKAWKIIIDPHNDQLSVALIAQRVEHSLDIAEVRVQSRSGLNFSALSTTT